MQDLIGVLPGLDFGVGQQGDDTVLKGAEAAFDLAFRLGCGGDEMRNAESAQGALEGVPENCGFPAAFPPPLPG